MNHPYEKLIRIVLISIFFSLIFGVVAIIKGYLLLIFLGLYLLMVSLLFEAIILYTTFRRAEASLQFLRAIMLFLFITYLFLNL
ncbi:hypothetical protein ACLIBG_04555 [Virgibacillus sp. W0181]|uniref:hypothetical protein n=1 Tax=Virgibacillus sp. W0181 TaxID=3391581 RepID=UPI003F44C432